MSLRIYVACLASYTAGTLHGVWIDCDGLDADDLGEAVQAMLADSKQPNAEEFAIHDFEGYPGIGEYTSLTEVAAISEALEEHGDAFLAASENFVGPSAVVSALGYLEENYRGVWDSLEDYAQEQAQDCGDMENVPDWLKYHIDWEGVVRDRSGLVGFRVNGGLHVFE